VASGQNLRGDTSRITVHASVSLRGQSRHSAGENLTGRVGLSIRRALGGAWKSFRIKSLEIPGQRSVQSLPVLKATTDEKWTARDISALSPRLPGRFRGCCRVRSRTALSTPPFETGSFNLRSRANGLGWVNRIFRAFPLTFPRRQPTIRG
jgi:hypothetical protein